MADISNYLQNLFYNFLLGRTNSANDNKIVKFAVGHDENSLLTEKIELLNPFYKDDKGASLCVEIVLQGNKISAQVISDELWVGFFNKSDELLIKTKAPEELRKYIASHNTLNDLIFKAKIDGSLAEPLIRDVFFDFIQNEITERKNYLKIGSVFTQNSSGSNLNPYIVLTSPRIEIDQNEEKTPYIKLEMKMLGSQFENMNREYAAIQVQEKEDSNNRISFAIQKLIREAISNYERGETHIDNLDALNNVVFQIRLKVFGDAPNN